MQPENEVSVTPVSVQTAMSLNGHGTNERTDGRTDRQADRRTDGLADTLDGDVTSESFQCTQTFSGYDVARNMARMSRVWRMRTAKSSRLLSSLKCNINMPVRG